MRGAERTVPIVLSTFFKLQSIELAMQSKAAAPVFTHKFSMHPMNRTPPSLHSSAMKSLSSTLPESPLAVQWPYISVGDIAAYKKQF